MTKRTAKIVENPDNKDELWLDLGLELCEELGWHEGDTIQWTQNQDGSWTLHKIQDSKN